MAHERGNRVWRAEPHHAWTYDFSYKRRRYSGSTQTQNKREAERVARCEHSRVVEEWHREHPFGASKRVRPLDMSFAQAVAAYMDDLARFAILTAMRLENFTGLLWRQIDFDRRTITLLQKGGNGRRKSHTIHMDDAILEVLQAQVGRHPKYVFVFTSKRAWTNPKNNMSYKVGEIYPITYWGFRTWWEGIREAADLMHITPHAFRRTAASRLVRFSGSLIAAQKLLGHSDIRTTAKHYAQFTSDDALTAQQAVRIATKERLSDAPSGDNTSQTDHKRKPQAA